MPLKVARAFPHSPSFGYIVAKRVVDDTRSSDCIIIVTGKRGSGKSIFSLTLAENVAQWIAKFAGGTPTDYFDINHVKSVSRLGGIEILSSDILLKKHSVIILDDAAISISAQKHQTTENSIVRDIVTIMRPFRGVLIVNSVFHRSIDKGTRSLADFIINIVGTYPAVKQTLSKVYKYTTGDTGIEYKKFLTWTAKDNTKYRMKLWVSGLPSDKIRKEYDALRMKNSISLVQEARERYKERIDKKGGGGTINSIHQKIRPTDLIITQHGCQVRDLKSQGMSIRKIAKQLSLTPYQVDRCLEGV